jgi:hypothetical protein
LKPTAIPSLQKYTTSTQDSDFSDHQRILAASALMV